LALHLLSKSAMNVSKFCKNALKNKWMKRVGGGQELED